MSQVLPGLFQSGGHHPDHMCNLMNHSDFFLHFFYFTQRLPHGGGLAGNTGRGWSRLTSGRERWARVAVEEATRRGGRGRKDMWGTNHLELPYGFRLWKVPSTSLWVQIQFEGFNQLFPIQGGVRQGYLLSLTGVTHGWVARLRLPVPNPRQEMCEKRFQEVTPCKSKGSVKRGLLQKDQVLLDLFVRLKFSHLPTSLALTTCYNHLSPGKLGPWRFTVLSR